MGFKILVCDADAKLDIVLHNQATMIASIGRLDAQIRQLLAQGVAMAKTAEELKAEMDAGFSAVNSATNSLASVLTKLRDDLKTKGTALTDADVDGFAQRLTDVATTLNGIAADPTQPVPAPVVSE